MVKGFKKKLALALAFATTLSFAPLSGLNGALNVEAAAADYLSPATDVTLAADSASGEIEVKGTPASGKMFVVRLVGGGNPGQTFTDGHIYLAPVAQQVATGVYGVKFGGLFKTVDKDGLNGANPAEMGATVTGATANAVNIKIAAGLTGSALTGAETGAKFTVNAGKTINGTEKAIVQIDQVDIASDGQNYTAADVLGTFVVTAKEAKEVVLGRDAKELYDLSADKGITINGITTGSVRSVNLNYANVDAANQLTGGAASANTLTDGTIFINVKGNDRKNHLGSLLVDYDDKVIQLAAASNTAATAAGTGYKQGVTLGFYGLKAGKTNVTVTHQKDGDNVFSSITFPVTVVSNQDALDVSVSGGVNVTTNSIRDNYGKDGYVSGIVTTAPGNPGAAVAAVNVSLDELHQDAQIAAESALGKKISYTYGYFDAAAITASNPDGWVDGEMAGVTATFAVDNSGKITAKLDSAGHVQSNGDAKSAAGANQIAGRYIKISTPTSDAKTDKEQKGATKYVKVNTLSTLFTATQITYQVDDDAEVKYAATNDESTSSTGTIYVGSADDNHKTRTIKISSNVGGVGEGYLTATMAANDYVTYANGTLTGVKEGTAKLVLAAKHNSATNGDLTLTLDVVCTSKKVDTKISTKDGKTTYEVTSVSPKATIGATTQYNNNINYEFVEKNAQTGKWVAAATPADLSLNNTDGTVTYKADNKRSGTAFIRVKGEANTQAVEPTPIIVEVNYGDSSLADSDLKAPAFVEVEVGKTVSIGATSVNKVTYGNDADGAIAKVAADGTVTGVAAGTTKVTVSAEAGTGMRAGSKEVTIIVKGAGETAKKANTLTAKAKKVTVKLAKVSKKNVTVARKNAITVSKAKGTVTYTKKSGNAKITVAKKTGKITVKKGLKKGTYKVKIAVKAAGNDSFKAATKTVTVTIVVK